MEKRTRVRFFKILLFLVTFSSLLFSVPNRIHKAEIVNNELRLYFTKNYFKKEIKSFVLTSPYRRVFDIEHTRLSKMNIARKLPKNIRIAQYRSNTVRVVIYTDTPYQCHAYMPFSFKQQYRIPLPKMKGALNDFYSEKYRDKKAPTKNFSLTSYSHKSELIVLDAGHGGHDSGAVGGGKKEKDLVLQIAKRLERELKKRGHPVYMTRRSDRFLKLSQRTKLADKKKAVLFISIHANAVPKYKRHRIHGIETFFLQKTRDAKSQRIAARENKSVLKGTSNLSRSVILDSVLSGPKIVQSNKLAIDVHKRMLKNVRSRYTGVKDGGVRHAPFWVLVGASLPSILVEVGYISHPKERKRLFQADYQALLVKGIAEGVDNYLNNRKKEIDF